MAQGWAQGWLPNEVRLEVGFGVAAVVLAAIFNLLISGYEYGRHYLFVPHVQVDVLSKEFELMFMGLGSAGKRVLWLYPLGSKGAGRAEGRLSASRPTVSL
jgi:hypothetical protein